MLLPEASIGAPFGDAVLAGMGLGLYLDPEETFWDLVWLCARYEPNLHHRALYDGLNGVFRNVYERSGCPEGPGGRSSEAVGRRNTRKPCPTPLGVPRLRGPGTQIR
jgi:hypothetical protein